MLNNLVPSEYIEINEYSIDFNDNDGGGFTFPCDERGIILKDMPEAAQKNYKWCIENANRFVEAGVFTHHKRHYREPAHGKCKCGAEVYLVDEYMGACECPECGRWYNMFGQELNPPEMWEEDY